MNLDDALGTYRADLVAAAHRWQVARGRRRGRIAVAASALALAAVIVGTAIAATGWLVGSPAPPSVKSDFGSYATQLGFNPRPGKAVLVASEGAYQLYATTNKQGGYCILVSAPWKRPGPHGEGGDCSTRRQASTSFWAGFGGIAPAPNGGSTLVIDGRTREAKAASLRFTTPDKRTLNVPVGSSGFFIVGATTQASWCQIAKWNPQVAILDSNGHKLTTARARIGRSLVCQSQPRPTITSADGHKVFTIWTTDHDRPMGYIAGARLGDQVTCRWTGHSVTLSVPVHGAHTARHGNGFNPSLQISRSRKGRVLVLCG
ncbi:MAG: hypothetical protein ACRDQZ_10710 [Mycobacteriales bacterium]